VEDKRLRSGKYAFPEEIRHFQKFKFFVKIANFSGKSIQQKVNQKHFKIIGN
jgi:hypothetical protein